jgi:GntR family transcriptional regulator
VKIDPRSHQPIYLQLADGIREAIAAGVYLPGEPLPSLRSLALDAQVNPNTVQRAYDLLTREGLVISRRGRGLFVDAQGTAAAQSRAEGSVVRKFEEGIRAGHAAGMDDQRVSGIFETTLRNMAQKGRHQ